MSILKSLYSINVLKFQRYILIDMPLKIDFY